MAGAPVGNTNSSTDNRLWSNTIRRALTQDATKLRKLADALIEKAEGGDIPALKEVGDRLEGKTAQQIILSGDKEQPLTIITRNIVRPPDDKQ